MLIVIAGVAVGVWNYRARDEAKLASLRNDAQRSAVAFDAAELRQLRGTRDDAATAVYAAVKARLRKLAAVDPRVRFVYIFRSKPETGQVRFIGDSAPAGGQGRVAAGR